MKTRKYTWGDRTWEFCDPKINRKRQLGLLGFIGLGVVSDLVIPCTFGQITRGVMKIVKLNPFYVYR